MLLNKIISFIHSKKEGMNCMKPTGITRRIDELGRVVIPKEIRKNMHIKSGELLEIFLIDAQTISLKKYTTINKSEEFISSFINALANKINANVFVTNMDEVVFTNVLNLSNKSLSGNFENNALSNGPELKLTLDYKLTKPFNVFPISPNGDLSGYLVFESKDNNFKTHEELIKFSLSFLESYFEFV